MKDWSELLHAIASLLWPMLAIGSVWYFRKELTDGLSRLKRGKFFGQEIELEEKLDKLSKSSLAAAS